jgi:hypothetical protein
MKLFWRFVTTILPRCRPATELQVSHAPMNGPFRGKGILVAVDQNRKRDGTIPRRTDMFLLVIARCWAQIDLQQGLRASVPVCE